MLLKCEIDRINTLKNGMKITLHLNQEETKKAMTTIVNFMDKPVTVELLVDNEKQKVKLGQISSEQRAKTFALIKDMANYTGDDPEELRLKVKQSFINATGHEVFSLANCSKELAGEFIEYLLTLAFELGVSLSESPIEGMDNIENYLKLCLDHRRCCVCGKPGEIHHCTGSRIGMGRNRDKINNKGEKVISLCRTHHNEIHTMPEEEFFEKYHVHGIVYEE